MCKYFICIVEYRALFLCSVDKDLSVRVSDFGLSRDVYSRDYYRMGLKAAKLPVKWMPPESLNYNMYNEKTDVVCSQRVKIKCTLFLLVVIWSNMLGDF